LESIIDRFLEFLPAPDVSFRRLHGRVAEKKLNLFEFTSSAMAKPSTGSGLIARQPVANSSAQPLDPLDSADSDCQFRAQQS
jgi:hypothetical protein